MSETSFTRWRGRAITQMGVANNTLLALALATIGFVIKTLLENKLLLMSREHYHDRLLLFVGGILLLISVISLLLLILNRLRDFNLTAQIARKRETNNRTGIDKDRKRVKFFGNLTWYLFGFSVIVFAVGEAIIIIGFAKYIYSLGCF